MKKQIWIGIVVGVMISFVVFRLFQNTREDRLLEETKQIKTILTEINKSAVRSPATGKYRYSVNGTDYEYEENRNFNDLKVGDTILIEYSVEDPSVARVVDKYYMKKYHHLKNGD